MAAKTARIICVGKLKNSIWQAACAHYLKLLRRWRDTEIVEIRDAEASLPKEERLNLEGKRILACLEGRGAAIALAADGAAFTSGQFAQFLAKADNSSQRRLTFIIGGPFGLAPEVIRAASLLLSLSPMTLPHELARALLLEQLFRAESIAGKFPYHY